jgi:solute carrier family 25 phosphate transporter 23/24/25/41
LFTSIDKDKNGRLDKSELASAFERSGVGVSNARLDRFFSYIDKDHDGSIDYNEWRGKSNRSLPYWSSSFITTRSQSIDFLLFIPTQAPGLHAVLSYYQSAAQITPEGDVHISDEALQGLGTTLAFLKTSAFGAITSLIRPSNPSYKQLPPVEAASQAVAAVNASRAAQLAKAGFQDTEDEDVRAEDDPHMAIKPARRKLKLTDLVPDVGYFIAGGVSGITSRTVTAPLDRLKVYLIAQTTNTSDAVQAAKSGAPVKAGKQGVRTLMNACKDLWAAGGIRSLFAGDVSPETKRRLHLTSVQAMESMSSKSCRNPLSNSALTRFVNFTLRCYKSCNSLTHHRPQNGLLPDSKVTATQETSPHQHNSSQVVWLV